MIRSFGDEKTKDVFDGSNTKAARKVPKEIHGVAQRKLDYLNAAGKLGDLRVPPGNRLEPLEGDFEGFHSIRINDQWRVCFVWRDGHAEDVEIVDYH